MAGYTRQSTGNIVAGQPITATPLNNEFNSIQTAFSSGSGHTHDGSTGSGPKINLTTSVSQILPILNGGTGAATLNAAGIVTLTGIETLTNKTLTSPAINAAALSGTFSGSPIFSGVVSITNTLQITPGVIEIGRTDGVSSTPFIDFHSGATAVDRDARIIVSGGTGSNNGGDMDITSATLTWNSVAIVTLSAIQTLTNKTITRPTITLQDSITTFQDNGDNTKQMQFQLNGLTTATTRTLTVQDASGSIALTTDIGLVKIGSATAAAAASASITDIPTSGYIRFILIGEDLSTNNAATTDQMRLQFSPDNGSSWYSSVGDYYSVASGQAYAMQAGCSGNTSTYKHGYFEINLYGLGNSARATASILMANIYGISSTSNTIADITAAANSVRAAATAENALRILPVNGTTLTGTFTLYGVRA